MQQLHAPSLPDTEPQAQYIINRAELLRLKSMGLVQDRLYVYLALKLDYPSDFHPSINIELFCEDWKITESELAIAIAQLQKKGVLAPITAQLELELF